MACAGEVARQGGGGALVVMEAIIAVPAAFGVVAVGITLPVIGKHRAVACNVGLLSEHARLVTERVVRVWVAGVFLIILIGVVHRIEVTEL